MPTHTAPAQSPTRFWNSGEAAATAVEGQVGLTTVGRTMEVHITMAAVRITVVADMAQEAGWLSGSFLASSERYASF